MKLNSEMQESIKRETDQNYREASEMFEEKAKKEEIAKQEVQRDLSNQKTNLKLRLAQRKKQQELRKSGFFDEEDSLNMARNKQPMSTRANSFMPRFGGIA